MSSSLLSFRACCLLIGLCGSAIAAPQFASAALFDFTASFTNNGAPSTRPFRLWLPNEEGGLLGATQPVRGLVLLLPGAGESWLTKANTINFQKAASSIGFGLLSAESMTWGANSIETRNIVESVLARAASASGRPELVNAPFATMGLSQGGYNATTIALTLPERAVGFVNIRGGYNVFELQDGAALEVPGLNIVGSKDGVVHPGYTRAGWDFWRSNNAPHAFAVEWNTTHFDTRKGQSWEAGWQWIGESVRLRYDNAGPLSTIPGVLPQLNPIDVSSGWLGHAPYINSADDLDNLVPPPSVEIASIASNTFSEPPSFGSWLPNKGTAQLYRAFTSFDRLSRPFIPRQGPLHFLSPVVTDDGTVATPLYEVGQTASFQTQVHPYDLIRNGIVLSDVDFYFNGAFLGNVVASNNWTIDVRFTEPGIQALVAIGHDSTGKEYPAFHTVLVAGTVPEPHSTRLLLAASVLLLGRFKPGVFSARKTFLQCE